MTVKQRTNIPGWVGPSIGIGLVMVLIGLFVSQAVGGIIVGLFNLVALGAVLVGIVGLVFGLFGVKMQFWKVLVATSVISVGAILAISLFVLDDGEGAAEASEYGEPEVSGQLAPMPMSSAVDSTVTGDLAPTVVGQDFNGNEVRIDNDGRAKAIVLLAHWCPHCQNEVTAVQAWLDSSGGVEGVEIYSVATATDTSRGNYPPSEWLDREGWTVPVIRDDSDNSVHVAYGSGGFPFWVFVNSDGTVAVRVSGTMPIEDLEEIMTSLR